MLIAFLDLPINNAFSESNLVDAFKLNGGLCMIKKRASLYRIVSRNQHSVINLSKFIRDVNQLISRPETQ